MINFNEIASGVLEKLFFAIIIILSYSFTKFCFKGNLGKKKYKGFNKIYHIGAAFFEVIIAAAFITIIFIPNYPSNGFIIMFLILFIPAALAVIRLLFNKPTKESNNNEFNY